MGNCDEQAMSHAMQRRVAGVLLILCLAAECAKKKLADDIDDDEEQQKRIELQSEIAMLEQQKAQLEKEIADVKLKIKNQENTKNKIKKELRDLKQRETALNNAIEDENEKRESGASEPAVVTKAPNKAMPKSLKKVIALAVIALLIGGVVFFYFKLRKPKTSKSRGAAAVGNAQMAMAKATFNF